MIQHCLLSPVPENHHQGKQTHSSAVTTQVHLQESRGEKVNSQKKKHKIKKTVSPKLSVSSQKRQLRFARNEIKGNKQIPIHRPKILQTNMGIVRTFLRQTLSSHQVCCNDRCTATNTWKEGCKNPSDLSKHKTGKLLQLGSCG